MSTYTNSDNTLSVTVNGDLVTFDVSNMTGNPPFQVIVTKANGTPSTIAIPQNPHTANLGFMRVGVVTGDEFYAYAQSVTDLVPSPTTTYFMTPDVPSVSIANPVVSVSNPVVSVSASVSGGALNSISSLRADTGGIYGHLTEVELVALRDQVVSYIKLVLKGESIINVSIAGKSVSKNLPSLEELKSELNEIKNALKAKDPITYGKKRRRFGFDHRFRNR